jgi:hypothetical protein
MKLKLNAVFFGVKSGWVYGFIPLFLSFVKVKETGVGFDRDQTYTVCKVFIWDN